MQRSYSERGLVDGPRNELLFQIIQKHQPKSFLQICPELGHLLRKVDSRLGIGTAGLEPDSMNFLLRTAKNIHPLNVTALPWPIKSKSFDFVFTDMVLDAVPEHLRAGFINELERVASRGLHITTKVQPSECRHQIIHHDETVDEIHIFLSSGVSKINLGCGVNMFRDGWFNFDMRPLGDVAQANAFDFCIHDIRNRLPFNNNAATTIVIAHVLDHLSPVQGRDVLLDCWRCLAVGGTIRVAIYDDAKITPEYNFLDDLNGRQITTSPEVIIEVMETLGYTHAKVSKFQESESKTIRCEAYDTLPDISTYVEARKLVL